MQAVTGGAHVPRAVLATAAEFGDVPRSMAEYIWNAFQYKRDRTVPAEVTIRFGRDASGKWFEVEDFPNGAGMDLDGLQRFFTMNAPNEDRLRGDPGRGRNGTGKAAAFGVGSGLDIYTVKNGVANEFRLMKDRLIACEPVYPCDTLPLEHTLVEQQVPPSDPQNGTRVRVSGIGVLTDEDAVVRNLTRIFMRVLDHNQLLWEKRPGRVVRVVRQPPHAVLDRTYQAPVAIAALVGSPTLRLWATDYDLPKQESGVIVTTVGGAVVESNYMNVSKRRSVVDKRIFGEIDVPLLDQPDGFGRLATTQARRLQMNRESERVEALLPWMDQCLDDFKEAIEQMLSSSLDERDRAVLDAISGTLEHVLNLQYEQFMRDYSTRMKLPRVNPLAPFPGDGAQDAGAPSPQGAGDQVYVPDGSGATNVVTDPNGSLEVAAPGTNQGSGGDAPGKGGTLMGREDPSGTPMSPERRSPKKAQAGRSLRVVYLGLGPTSVRAYFDGEGTFTINKDHPDFRGLDSQDSEFMRRSAEACAVTYAEAVVEMRITDGDPTVTQPKDALNAYLEEHDRVLRPLIDVCPDF